MPPQHEQRDHGEQQRALEDVRELRGHAELEAGRVGADDQVAEEEGGEDDARHAQRAERGDDDPRVAEAGRDAVGQLVVDPGNLARPRHAGDRAAHERRPQQEPLDPDPGEPCRLGAEPDRAQPQPGRCPGEHEPGDRDDRQREHEAEVDARVREDLRKLRVRRDPLRLGELRHRVAPWAVEQARHEEQGDRVEEQCRHDLVDAEVHAHQRRAEHPHRAAERARHGHRRDRERTRHPAHMRAHPGGRDRAREELPLGADVPEAGAERDRDRGTGEEERRRRDEHLQARVAGRERLDDEGVVGVERVRARGEDEADRDGERDHDRRRRDHEPEPARGRRTRLQANRDHAAAASPSPAISSPSRSGSASAAGSRPTIVPS